MIKGGKEGEIAVQTVAAIILTLVVLGLVFMLASNVMSQGNLYCKTIYKVKGGFWYNQKDAYCERIIEMETVLVNTKEITLAHLGDGVKEVPYDFSTAGTHTFTLDLPANADLKEARFEIEVMPGKITLFDGPGEPQTTDMILNFPRKGGTHQISFRIPKSATISNAKIRAEGVDVPGLADIVFVIDSSASMNDEWASVCQSISYVATAVNETTDLKVMIYALTDHYTPDWPTDCRGSSSIIVDQQRLKGSQLSHVEDVCPMCRLVPWNSNVGYPSHHDRYSEAWGAGVYWVMHNYNFRPNSKHLILPVSDSDPTGGGSDPKHLNIPNGTDIFTGTEGPVIQAVIDSLQTRPMDYIFPIYGNLIPEGGNQDYEGYRVGLPPSECSAHPRCSQVISWMEDLATASGGEVSSYKDTTFLVEAVKRAINTSFPENLLVSLDSHQVRYFDGELNDTNSPVFIEFWDQLEQYLATCSPTAGYCDVVIDFDTSSEGSLALDLLNVDYFEKAGAVNVLVDGVIAKTGSSESGAPLVVDITEEVRAYVNETCGSNPCSVPLSLTAPGYTSGLKVTRASVVYDVIPLEDTVLEEILNCWDLSERGKSSDHMLCREIPVPEGYVFEEPISEQLLTQLLQERNFCGILPNSDFNCGDGDALFMGKSINSVTNIVVEYDPEKKQVVIT